MHNALATRDVDATPFAASLIEGHRDFGYSLETALADIIDNAITAGAQTVRLNADTAADEPWIALADDGSTRPPPLQTQARSIHIKSQSSW